MTAFNGFITGIVAGNHVDITRTVTDVPATQTLSKAWLTFKESPADPDPGVVQKMILPGAVADQGQITDTGADGTAALLFQLTAQNTLDLPVGRRIAYEIKVLTSAGKLYTAEQGYYFATQGLTDATS